MGKSTEISKVIDRLSSSNNIVDFHKPTEINEDLEKYFTYYGLNLNKIDIYFGCMDINETAIFVQTFAPKISEGTVILLHGYLDHVGHLKHIIHYLNEHNYTVVSYDLQGHGLSEGEVASISQFSDYVETLETLMERVNQELSGPFYAIGHSTGGAIVANYVLKNMDQPFEKVILVAPVIRSNFWYWTKLGIFLVTAFPFIRKVKRHFRMNSSNSVYLQSVRKDPLQPEVIPLTWTRALMKWNKNIQQYGPVDTKACIIQGMDDKTVDWKYNLKFITGKFPDSKVVYIEKGKHALFNESKTIRDQVCSFVVNFIQE